MKVVAAHIPDAPFDNAVPRMQLQLGHIVQTAEGGPLPTVGSLWVLCDLNQEQCEYVRAHDVPASLLKAMSDAADGAGWTAALPSVGTPPIVIDPAPHFPTAPK